MCGNDGVNHVIAQCVNHVSLDKVAAATLRGTVYPHRFYSQRAFILLSLPPVDKGDDGVL